MVSLGTAHSSAIQGALYLVYLECISVASKFKHMPQQFWPILST